MADAVGNKAAHDYHLDTPPIDTGFFAKGLGNTDWGMKNRLSRIFSPTSGNTVMLAFDHGYIMGATAGLERLDVTIAPLCGHADVLMGTRGAIRSCIPPTLNKATCLRATHDTSVLFEDMSTGSGLAFDMEEALRMNASALAIQCFVGGAGERDSLEALCRAADAGYKYGVPILGVTAVGKEMARTPKYFGLASRILAELGASARRHGNAHAVVAQKLDVVVLKLDAMDGEQLRHVEDVPVERVLHRRAACTRQKYAIQMVFAHAHRLRDAVQRQRFGIMPIQIQLCANAETIPRLLNLFLCRALQAQRQQNRRRRQIAANFLTLFVHILRRLHERQQNLLQCLAALSGVYNRAFPLLQKAIFLSSAAQQAGKSAGNHRRLLSVLRPAGMRLSRRAQNKVACLHGFLSARNANLTASLLYQQQLRMICMKVLRLPSLMQLHAFNMQQHRQPAFFESASADSLCDIFQHTASPFHSLHTLIISCFPCICTAIHANCSHNKHTRVLRLGK